MSTYYNPIHDTIMTMAPERYDYSRFQGDKDILSPAMANNNKLGQMPLSNGSPKDNQDDTMTTNTTNSKISTKGNNEPKKLLSTSSPEGIQVASKITPTRLANLLIRKGPLPIRHITSQLAVEVPSFDMLSLSKQRRLIMAAMEQTDTHNNVVFEKIGWGQWAVRKVDSDYIVTEGTEAGDKNTSVTNNHPNGNSTNDRMLLINVHDLRNQTNLKLGWSKKQAQRRESITNSKTNPHNVRLPSEKMEKLDDSVAIASDSSDDEELEDAEFGDDGDDAMFAFEEETKSKRSPPMTFAKRVPLKVSPPPGEATSRSRRRSSSSNPGSSGINKNGYRQYFNRSRLNLMENLDGYIRLSAKSLSMLVSSPPTTSLQSIQQAMSVSPPFGNNYVHQAAGSSSEGLVGIRERRKSSFNELHIRLTLLLSMPKGQSVSIANMLNRDRERNERSDESGRIEEGDGRSGADADAKHYSDTDEEDWATIGAELLRRQQRDEQGQRRTSHLGSGKRGEMNDEESAAFALVDLRSV